MLVLLVRHGHAGTRHGWHGDDRRRPLSSAGFRQADALVELLSDYRPHRIISSPLVRCVQTMTPLAQSLGLRIERTKRLTPDAGDAATNLLRRVGQGSDAVVLCTHGEVIHELQSKLEGHTHLFGRNPLRGKGSVWALEQVDGRFVTATYLPPPPHRR